jgi:DNA-binding NtrC family response regulator
VPRAVDVRVVAATHQDLQERITEGLFREDLYYRLNGISVLVPPLRERPLDIAPLAGHFAGRFVKKGGTTPRLSEASLAHLREHTWPGNVRELRNVIERASILCDGEVIEPRHLPLDAPRRSPPALAVPDAEGTGAAGNLRHDVKLLEHKRIEAALRDAGGNQRRAAETLGLSRGALLRRIEQLGIPRPHKGR